MINDLRGKRGLFIRRLFLNYIFDLFQKILNEDLSSNFEVSVALQFSVADEIDNQCVIL